MNHARHTAGYTLIELIVAVGLFALVMLLSSGAYIMMMHLTRQTQGIAGGIDNLSFALETMARSIRTGTHYCGGSVCPGTSQFTFTNEQGKSVSYQLSGTSIQQTVNGATSALTDPSVTVTTLKFIPTGTAPYSSGSDTEQSRVLIDVAGTITYAAGKTEPFNIETSATMRGSDL